MMQSVLFGVHTYSVSMVLTYNQFKKIKKACYKTGCIQDISNAWKGKEQLYYYGYHERGIKVYLHGKSGKLYRVRIQIEPCRVLKDADPTTLFQPNKRSYRQLVRATDKLLEKLEVPCSTDSMKICRCDLTANIEFSSQEELMEYLRIFKKSLVIPHYKCSFFRKNGQKVTDWRPANAHSHCLSCKSASFLIYDKIAQLEMIGRCDKIMLGKHILRLEAELKRPALKKHLGKKAVFDNQSILLTASVKCPKVIDWYIKRLLTKCNQYLRYEDAVKQIEQAKLKEKTRTRMLYLLRKTSDKNSLTAALESLRDKYSLTKSQCNTILKKFKRLGISPITLRNNSKFDILPTLDLE